MLLRGDEMAKGQVVAWSYNPNENVIGRAHINPILDTRTYQVEFGGEVTELMANVIAESMNIQCDADRNEYLLLDVLVNYWKDNKAISLTDQQITVQGRPVPVRPMQVGRHADNGRTVLPHGRMYS